jgi:hypothetical protein
MSGTSDLEQAIVWQERRLLVLRRQAVRGRRHVLRRLTRLERQMQAMRRSRGRGAEWNGTADRSVANCALRWAWN